MPIIEKSILAKPTDEGLTYIFPKTSADCVYYDEENEITIKDKLEECNEAVNKLREEMGGMTYESLSIKSFTCNPSYVEYGDIIKSIEFDFEFNRVPKLITIKIGKEVYEIENTKTNITLDNLDIKSSTQCTLTVYDKNDTYNSKTVNINLNRRYYYGVSKVINTLHGLTSIVKNTKTMNINVNAGNEEYIYFACPINNITDETTFNVGGFVGGFELIGLVYIDTVCNDSGFGINSTIGLVSADESNIINTSSTNDGEYITKQTYALYRSENIGLGNTIINIS